MLRADRKVSLGQSLIAAVDLGRQDGLLAALAALGEPGAEHLLGAALALVEAVDVGRVEEVDPLGQRPVHDLVRVGLLGLPAEVHGAQAEPGDRQAAASEVRVVHAIHPGTLAAVPQDDASASSAFDAATAVHRTEGGGLLAELDPGWDVGGGILNGGYLLAVAGSRRGPGEPAPASGRALGQLPARAGRRAGDPHRRARPRRADPRALASSPSPTPTVPALDGPGDDGDARRRGRRTGRADARVAAGRGVLLGRRARAPGAARRADARV